MVMPILAESPAPPLSVTVAVMVWPPSARAAVEKLLPLPILPLIFELQLRLAERLPSSASFAVPENETVAPEEKVAPFPGLLIDTVGAALPVLASLAMTIELPLLSLSGS